MAAVEAIDEIMRGWVSEPVPPAEDNSIVVHADELGLPTSGNATYVHGAVHNMVTGEDSPLTEVEHDLGGTVLRYVIPANVVTNADHQPSIGS